MDPPKAKKKHRWLVLKSLAKQKKKQKRPHPQGGVQASVPFETMRACLVKKTPWNCCSNPTVAPRPVTQPFRLPGRLAGHGQDLRTAEAVRTSRARRAESVRAAGRVTPFFAGTVFEKAYMEIRGNSQVGGFPYLETNDLLVPSRNRN